MPFGLEDLLYALRIFIRKQAKTTLTCLMTLTTGKSTLLNFLLYPSLGQQNWTAKPPALYSSHRESCLKS